MDIRHELSIGMPFRVADILAEHGCFSAYFTLQGKFSFDLLTGVL